MERYLFSDLTRPEIKRIVKLTERRIALDAWIQADQIVLVEEEKQHLAHVISHLLPYETTLMNEATIWGRAVYPLLLMVEHGDIQSWAGVSLQAKYSQFELEGIVDAVIGKCLGGVMEVPYIVVVEAKRGLEGTNPRFQLYGEMLAAARLNWEENRHPAETIFGCYTIADSWTFLRAKVSAMEDDIPEMSIESTREYVEKIEAEIILKTLKYMVACFISGDALPE